MERHKTPRVKEGYKKFILFFLRFGKVHNEAPYSESEIREPFGHLAKGGFGWGLAATDAWANEHIV